MRLMQRIFPLIAEGAIVLLVDTHLVKRWVLESKLLPPNPVFPLGKDHQRGKRFVDLVDPAQHAARGPQPQPARGQA